MNTIDALLKENVSSRDIKVVLVTTAIISLLLSLSQVLSDLVIDSDGIFYLSIAAKIQSGDWQAAAKQYNWLFFPALIAQLSTLTSLSIEHAAYLINAVFSAITCSVFVLLTLEFGAKNKGTLWFASLIILCFPNLNEYRNMIMRDHGYWAFYLLSCYFFIRAYQHASVKTLLLLLASLVLASLFRIEGIALTLALPAIVILHRTNSFKAKHITIQVITVALVALFTYVIFNAGYIDGLSKVSQIERAIGAPFAKLEAFTDTTTSYLNQLDHKGFSSDYAPAVLGLTFLLILSTEILGALSPLYATALIISFIKSNAFKSSPLFRPWIYLILINIVILSGFLISKFFLAGRYPIALALTLLTPLPSLAYSCYQAFREKKLNKTQLRVLSITIGLFVILSLDGLISTGASKTYLKDAGEWIVQSKQNKEVRLFTNHKLVSFYANSQSRKRIKELSFDNILVRIKSDQLRRFNVLAIQVSRRKPTQKQALFEALGSKPIKTFNNKKGDAVYVFEAPWQDLSSRL